MAKEAGVTKTNLSPVCYSEDGALGDGEWLESITGHVSYPAINFVMAGQLILVELGGAEMKNLEFYEEDGNFSSEYKGDVIQGGNNIVDVMVLTWLKNKKADSTKHQMFDAERMAGLPESDRLEELIGYIKISLDALEANGMKCEFDITQTPPIKVVKYATPDIDILWSDVNMGYYVRINKIEFSSEEEMKAFREALEAAGTFVTLFTSFRYALMGYQSQAPQTKGFSEMSQEEKDVIIKENKDKAFSNMVKRLNVTFAPKGILIKEIAEDPYFEVLYKDSGREIVIVEPRTYANGYKTFALRFNEEAIKLCHEGIICAEVVALALKEQFYLGALLLSCLDEMHRLKSGGTHYFSVSTMPYQSTELSQTMADIWKELRNLQKCFLCEWPDAKEEEKAGNFSQN